jgi:disulfide oxidoreductase YuzD
MEFAHSIIHVKPYLEVDMNLNVKFVDIVNVLRSDKDKEVVDAIENCEYLLL